jgi:hypothetical protein
MLGRRWHEYIVEVCAVRVYWFAFNGMKAHRHYPDVEHLASLNRHLHAQHRLESDFIALDEDGEPLGEPQAAYKPLRPLQWPTSTFEDGAYPLPRLTLPGTEGLRHALGR